MRWHSPRWCRYVHDPDIEGARLPAKLIGESNIPLAAENSWRQATSRTGAASVQVMLRTARLRRFRSKLVVGVAVAVACSGTAAGVALASGDRTVSSSAVIATADAPIATLEGSGSHLRWSDAVVSVQALDSAAECQVGSKRDQQLKLVNLTGGPETLVPDGVVLQPGQPLFVGCFENHGKFVYSLYDHPDVRLTVVVLGSGIGSPAKVSGTLTVTHGTVAELQKLGGTIELNGLPVLEMINFAENGSFTFDIPAGTYNLLVWLNSKGGDACGSTPISVEAGRHLTTTLVCHTPLEYGTSAG
jgi:hypothetical protein